MKPAWQSVSAAMELTSSKSATLNKNEVRLTVNMEREILRLHQ